MSTTNKHFLKSLIGAECYSRFLARFWVTITKQVVLVKSPDSTMRAKLFMAPGSTTLMVQIFSTTGGAREEAVLDFLPLDMLCYGSTEMRPGLASLLGGDLKNYSSYTIPVWKSADGDTLEPEVPELLADIENYLNFWLTTRPSN